MLPVNATGILLIALGLGLLILEVKVPSFGVLGIGGLVSLIVGAVMITSEVPGVQRQLSASSCRRRSACP